MSYGSELEFRLRHLFFIEKIYYIRHLRVEFRLSRLIMTKNNNK